jgi:lactate dehydrogenase-like 2-hydroxyacid dehydrogenase
MAGRQPPRAGYRGIRYGTLLVCGGTQLCNPITNENRLTLMTFPNVMITGHQAFFTEDAMRAIALLEIVINKALIT